MPRADRAQGGGAVVEVGLPVRERCWTGKEGLLAGLFMTLPPVAVSAGRPWNLPEVIKKTVTLGMAAWIKVLLTEDSAPAPGRCRPYWRSPGRPCLRPI